MVKELFITNIGSHMWKMNKPESDIDLFVGVLASTKSYLQGKPDFTYSKVSGDPGAVGQEDRNTHELGKIVEQLLKNNWNFITGVMSPIVVKDWDRLDDLRDLLNLNLSKLAYHSIHGLAIHNFRKYIQNERDDSAKRCNTIGRTIQMGIKLLREGVIDFAPISGVTPKDIPKFIDELDLALKESVLPDKPQNESALRDFLLDVRLEELKNLSESIVLPIAYSKSSYSIKNLAKKEYIKQQEGLCYYCQGKLIDPPLKDEAVIFLIQKAFDSEIFPKNFLETPIHLHHDHKTDLTLGVVHAYCNAALWVIEGE